MKNILVLGIGNLLLTDDGVGVHAVHQLLKEEWPECVKLLDAGTFTQDVFYLFEGYEELIILDITQARNLVPCTVSVKSNWCIRKAAGFPFMILIFLIRWTWQKSCTARGRALPLSVWSRRILPRGAWNFPLQLRKNFPP